MAKIKNTELTLSTEANSLTLLDQFNLSSGGRGFLFFQQTDRFVVSS